MLSNLYKKNSIYELVPVKMPHYTLCDGKILFMNYKSKFIPANLMVTFNNINNKDTVNTLINKGILLEDILLLEKERYIVLSGKRPQKSHRFKVLILAPHCDDAIFSLGGCLWKYGEYTDFHIVNVFGRQDYTIYWNLFESSREPDFVHKEEKMAWRLLCLNNGQIWDFDDAPLRSAYKNKNVILPNEATESVVQKEYSFFKAITLKVKNCIDTIMPDMVLTPLGIGGHVDHILLREASLNILGTDKILYFYEDLPYAITFDINNTFMEIQSRFKATFEKKKVNIQNWSSHKKYLLNIYRSQLMPHQVKAISNYGSTESGIYENIWHFKS